MKITLVRHAETQYNTDNKIQGLENNKLSKIGIMHAVELKSKVKDINYDVCYMSPLARCVETAIVMIGDRVKTIPDKRLIERDMGELEGKDFSEYDVNLYWDYDKNCSDNGVEAIQSIFDRCEEFLEELKTKGYENVLIVSHASPIRVLHTIITNKDIHSNLRDIDIPNCFIEELEMEV